eukprot:CFRG1414T1
MKVLFAIASLCVASAYATHGQAEFFATSDCTGDHVVNSGFDSMQKICHKQTNAVEVSELADASYSYVRWSNDAQAEVYLFPTEEACKNYPLQFSATDEVAFIRSTDPGKCQPCVRCGDNVKSVRLTPVITNSNLDTTKSAAGTYAPTTIGALVVAGAAFLLA